MPMFVYLASLVTYCVHVEHVASDTDQLHSCLIRVLGLTLTFYVLIYIVPVSQVMQNCAQQ